jgi:xanthosine utilization system XapX-like protein
MNRFIYISGSIFVLACFVAIIFAELSRVASAALAVAGVCMLGILVLYSLIEQVPVVMDDDDDVREYQINNMLK